MAANFYALVVLRVDGRRLRRLLRWELGALVLGSAVVSFSLLAAGAFGDATLWCWVASSSPGAQLGGFYSFVVVAWAACLFVLVAIREHSARPPVDLLASAAAAANGNAPMLNNGARAKQQQPASAVAAAARAGAAAVHQRLRLYIISFVGIWSVGLCNRVWGAAAGSSPFPLVFLHVLFVPLQGLLNALVYFGHADSTLATLARALRAADAWLNGDDRPKWLAAAEMSGDVSSSPLAASASVSASASARASAGKSGGWTEGQLLAEATDVPTDGESPTKAKTKRLFVTTFNLGEASLEGHEVAAWLPVGFDLYAIGVQECMDLARLRSAALDHLNRAALPSSAAAASSSGGAGGGAGGDEEQARSGTGEYVVVGARELATAGRGGNPRGKRCSSCLPLLIRRRRRRRRRVPRSRTIIRVRLPLSFDESLFSLSIVYNKR